MRYPCQLEADFRQYYGLYLHGREFPLSHYACLAAQLPHESRCIKAQNPDAEWSVTDWLLWRLDSDLRAAFGVTDTVKTPSQRVHEEKAVKELKQGWAHLHQILGL